MMDRRIIPLIMCGGAGTRLWPASREVRPKQFLPLFGARSTFQDTLKRVSDAGLFERPIIITNAAYRFMVLEQLAEIGIEADLEDPAPDGSGKAARDVEGLKREDAPALRLDPIERRVIGGIGHREDAHGIGFEENLGRYLAQGAVVSGDCRAAEIDDLVKINRSLLGPRGHVRGKSSFCETR